MMGALLSVFGHGSVLMQAASQFAKSFMFG